MKNLPLVVSSFVAVVCFVMFLSALGFRDSCANESFASFMGEGICPGKSVGS